jgi:hypothetical protein
MSKKIYWAGFVKGKPYRTDYLYQYEGNIAIFSNKEAAKRFYKDVRAVEIVEIKNK